MKVENLKAYLANIGMTIKEFSIIIEADHKYLSRIIHKKCYPSKRLAKDIREVTGGIVDIPIRPVRMKKDERKKKITTDSNV